MLNLAIRPHEEEWLLHMQHNVYNLNTMLSMQFFKIKKDILHLDNSLKMAEPLFQTIKLLQDI